jgi:2-polyprenyl-3-methyl-5-hydroxy-6-metoxy-1,4-benzoquinol methylase
MWCEKKIMNNFWEEELQAGYYDEILSNGLRNKKGIQANWHNLTFLKVGKLIKNSDIHLDYACGPGTFTGKYCNSKSLGVDISEIQINYAKENYPTDYTLIKNLDIENSSDRYDKITLLGLCEFISDEEILHLLSMFYNLLKPGGKVVVTTPNFNSSVYVFRNLFRNVNYVNTHTNKFNKKRLHNLLSKTDFKNIEVNKFLNIGILFSIFNLRVGQYLNNAIEKLFFNNSGYLLIAELNK